MLTEMNRFFSLALCRKHKHFNFRFFFICEVGELMHIYDNISLLILCVSVEKICIKCFMLRRNYRITRVGWMWGKCLTRQRSRQIAEFFNFEVFGCLKTERSSWKSYEKIVEIAKKSQKCPEILKQKLMLDSKTL